MTNDNDAPSIHDADIRLLRIFKSVVDCQGFTAAEDTLGIGRSAISKYISDLEVRLGLHLCDRGRAGFSITPHGEIVYQATIELLDSLDSFRHKVAESKGRLFGSLSLWTMDYALCEPGNPVGMAISKFRTRPGKVTLHVNAAAPAPVEDAVALRKANVGITIANNALPGLNYVEVGEEATSLYCGQHHELLRTAQDGVVNHKDLKGHDFVTRGYLRDAPAIELKSYQSTAFAYHIDATIQLILNGNYIGVIPDHIALALEQVNQETQLVRLKAEGLNNSNPIYVVSRENSEDMAGTQALVEDIIQAYKDR